MNYLRELALLPRGVKQFLFSEPFLGMAFGLHSLLFNLHLLALHITEIEIGKITAIGSIVMALFAIPFGLLADRFGRKRILVSGLFCMTISHYLIALGTHYMHFLSAQILLSLGLSMMVSAEIPLLFKYCHTRKEETQTYNMMFAVFTLFIGIGTLIGGYLPQFLDATRDHYRGTMMVMALSMTIVMLARCFLPDEQHKSRVRRDAEKSIPRRFQLNIGQVLPSKKVLIYVVFSVFAGASHAIVIPFMNIIVKFRLDWTDPMVAILLTVNGLALFLASFFTPYLLDRWGMRKLSTLLFALTICTSLMLGMLLPLSLFIILFLFRSGMFTALYNVVEGQTMQATKDEERSLHASLRSIGKSLGSTLAAYVAGFILAAENYWLPFVLSGVITVMAYIYYRYMMMEYLEADLQEEYE